MIIVKSEHPQMFEHFKAVNYENKAQRLKRMHSKLN